LFYIFYNMPGEKAQLQAAESLEQRGWTYIEEDMRWVRMNAKAGKEASFTRFNPETWKEEPFN
jgi:CCR4-NOT transcriptional regulation complex NOT5 subunit